MFEAATGGRVFGLPPGVDFPAVLVAGLRARMAGTPPEAMARVTLIVNTRRMARRIRDLFDAGAPGFLPRILLVTDLGSSAEAAEVPPAVPALRRRLELSQLIAALLQQAPELAPRASLYALSDSLADLMAEMQGEGVSPEVIKALDVSDQSGHWDRAKTFLDIALRYFDDSDQPPDAESRQRRVIEALVARWQDAPPADPIILAGSTGSRGATQMLMRAIARLPQGAVVLPGMDFDLPAEVWNSLDDALSGEDHPQFRFSHFLRALDMSPDAVTRWHDTPAPAPDRNRVLSLALRPAPVTDQWLREGPSLPPLDRAFRDVTLLEAPSSRAEALAIALRLRRAAEEGTSAALITPDRVLTRQVTAALDRWNILPDDSAGAPLHLSPPGRFLRQVAALGDGRVGADTLIALLKHPLTNSGPARGQHLLLTRELELDLRRNGPPYPTAESLRTWAAGARRDGAEVWADWIASAVLGADPGGDAALLDRVDRHILRAEAIAAGPGGLGAGELWDEGPGRAAREMVDQLRAESVHGGAMGPRDYEDLFHAVLSGGEVRTLADPHPLIRIWGTLEARVQGADLLILAGLNESTWPEAPKPDPWLNRRMRHDAGLLLPERRIGLSAHDFQQAVGAAEVWITRAIRSDDAESVPSRWLNRVLNLLEGLPDQGGRAAVAGMRERGDHWLHLARSLESVAPVSPAPRPSPAPPTGARPTQLSVTEIKWLIRDPYAIYAKHVLRLRPLDALMRAPDALLRGIALHDFLEGYVKAARADPALATRTAFCATARDTLERLVPWADARLMWLARLERVADWFVDQQLPRALQARDTLFEVRGAARLADLDFTLTAKADRVDVLPDGRVSIIDYKTGKPPSKPQQLTFDKQLLLEAAIAERGGFGDLGPSQVAEALYIGLTSAPTEVPAPLDDAPITEVWAGFARLVGSYAAPGQGFTSRRAMFTSRDLGNYDQLARFGEWDASDAARKVSLV